MRADALRSGELHTAILYLLYPRGPGYQRERPIRELHRIVSRLPGRKTVVYIDNSACGADPRQLGDDEYAIGGDNTWLEFSGWQKGVDFLRSRRLASDVCLFANDTLLAQSRFHRRLVNRSVVECALRHRAMVGQRMTLPANGGILGNPLIPYVRTHLFLLPYTVVEELGSVVSLDRRSLDLMLLSAYDSSVHLFQANAPVATSIREYILFHLHSSWHRRKPYTPEHFAELRGKTTSILNALLLSRRVHDLGYPLATFAKAARFLRPDATPERMRAEWIDRQDAGRAAEGTASNGFWRRRAAVYQRVGARTRPFSLENILDFLERSRHPEHL